MIALPSAPWCVAAVAALASGYLYVSRAWVEADLSAARQDAAQYRQAAAASAHALADVQADLSARDTLLADRDAAIAELNAAARDTAAALEAAPNDPIFPQYADLAAPTAPGACSPCPRTCDIDAELPAGLPHPLRILCADSAASRGRTPGGAALPAARPVSGSSDAAYAASDDGADSRPVGGAARRLGN